MRKEYNLNLRGENDVSEKRFSTDDIVATVMKWRGWDMDRVDEPAYKEIIARLRAADALMVACVGAGWFIENFGGHRHMSEHPEECAHCWYYCFSYSF